MVSPTFGLLSGNLRSDQLRMRTLILLRWMAIAGQIAAIVVADIFYKIQLPIGLCYLVVGASIIANLVSSYIFPATKRLSEAEALLTLMFDLSQLSLLVFLTGGLANPFALLILAPVTISATALRLRTTVFLGGLAIALISFAAITNVPLRLPNGAPLEIPQLFKFGFWLSIVVGIVFLSLYARRIATEMRSMSNALLATQMALAREQKLTDLGGVVAAAAHELGTPLATIKLVSTEMMDDLAAMPDLLQDIRLIRDSADRCRDILRSMGRAGKDDIHLRQAPFEAVLREAAEPHIGRGKLVTFSVLPVFGGQAVHPNIHRRPEVIHGLRNLIQNAVDFASSTVWIEAEWSDTLLSVRIIDDGSGFPPQIIGRIGDPFVRARAPNQDVALRPDYEGMGLGLFIAKTLLERTGADLSFANASDRFLKDGGLSEKCGAIVEVRWPRDALSAPVDFVHGDNIPFYP
ncbi:MAG: ActS/PrrB/RegB family redox-sensitive histidine kinase [Rhodoferax sp.]|nr:ActS/PrrB/RegB family redox-sensitive histidine kinase [Pseudorhodobacter sp.]